MPEPAVRFRGEEEPMIANAARPLSTAAWWEGLDEEVLEVLAEYGPMAPDLYGSHRAECASTRRMRTRPSEASIDQDRRRRVL